MFELGCLLLDGWVASLSDGWVVVAVGLASQVLQSFSYPLLLRFCLIVGTKDSNPNSQS